MKKETKYNNIEDAWLGLENLDIDNIFNPCDFLKPTQDDFESRLAYLMSQPEYFSFLCKHILNIQLLPVQCLMLEELWTRKFPMLIATRGFSKSFSLSLYSIIRALLLNGRKIVIVGSAFRQSKVLYEYMDTMWRNAPLLRDMCDDRSGPKRDNDRCSLIINDSTIVALPLGYDGSKIRGQRAHDIIADEFASIPRDIFENVVAGFTAVSANPIDNVKRMAAKKKAEEYGIELEEEEMVVGKQTVPNQIILSGTAYYDFNHFAEYWKKWKKFIKSDGDRNLLREAFNGEEPPENFDHSHFSVLRIPYELTPKGFMDADQISRSKATVHSGIYQMEFGACAVHNTPIITNRGVIPLGEVLVGDYVLTSNGRFKQVLKVYTNHYKGKICDIYTEDYHEKLTFTPNHPFLSTNGKFLEIENINSSICFPKLKTNNIHEIDCLQILDKAVQQGSKVYYSISKLNNEEINRIRRSKLKIAELSRRYNMSTLAISQIRKNKKRKDAVNKIIKLDQSFGLCLGYYLMSSNKDKFNIKFPFIHEQITPLADELALAFYRAFGIKPNIKNSKIKTGVSLGLSIVKDILDYCSTDEIIFGNSEIIKGFVRAVWNFNGIVNVHEAKLGIKDEDFICKIRIALSHFGINTSLHRDKDGFELKVKPDSLSRFTDAIYNDIEVSNDVELLSSKITKKEYRDFDGYVYNLEVEDDHTYCTPIAVVHNCFTKDSQGFFKRSLIESCVPSMGNPIKSKEVEISFEPMLIGNPDKKYVFGVDPASEVDNFSIVILELNHDHRRIVYCWTTNRSQHKELQKHGFSTEKDFYAFCARKIRDLMKNFNCVHIALDAQGGGIAVMECLHDDDKIKVGELPIWPVIDPDKPADTDGERGLHILEMCQFARYDWLSEANHGMKKDFEDKVLLFPYFDFATLGMSIADDQLKSRKYDTLEDCVLDIEELKNELSIIEITQTANGRDRWDTPESIVNAGKKVRARKDRYSALLMANMASRIIQRSPDPIDYQFYGGFAHSQPAKRKKANGELYSGPAWFTEAVKNIY